MTINNQMLIDKVRGKADVSISIRNSGGVMEPPTVIS
jgi:hypothetical protein